MSPRLPHVALAVLLTGHLLAGRAAAQEDEDPKPIPRVALDLRGTYVRYTVNTDLESLGTITPSRGLGGAVALHVYPLRFKALTIGIGGEWLTAQGGQTPVVDDVTGIAGPRVTTRFKSLAPQLSVNFGNRNGWSYISAGLGKSSYSTRAGSTEIVNGPDARLNTLHYGAGARWSLNAHVALSLDVRLYTLGANPAVGTLFGTPRTRLLVVGAGLSFH
jgi:hypothetical protein